MRALKRWGRKAGHPKRALLARVLPREPAELSDALRRECDDHLVVLGHSRVVAPNAYEVELPTAVYEKLARRGRRVGQDLADTLARHGENRKYEWAGPLAVRVTTGEDLPDGHYRVTSSATPNVRVGAFADHGEPDS
ncbi:DUF2662 domain-containing protein [Streptomyces sp. TRM43335]|uniref:DUF2662 domain-containing protein n=1 Tax=Streptomyces taklimakanensis TaxID=2569853 RepID=A0A6G2BJ14_9ACTN|nr:DUF3662 domain-containing protein [Streptomyces taklimakanensis]MTE22275.1 DUF2662 domain-containing protein [Streptomyces taklimakanensis]